jgi:predicted MFS family arabinose efflux permease
VGLGVLGRVAPQPSAAEPRPETPRFSSYRSRAVWLLGAIYWLFGFTYVIYVTFFVTSLVKERGFSEAIAGSFWAVIGFLSLFSGPVFGTLSDRLGRRAGLAIVFSLQAVAYLLVALPLPDAALYVSIACFGVVAWSIPSIMLAAVSDQVGPEHALSAFGFITFVFGLGQIAGPAVAGALAERTGSFRSAFGLAAALAALAIALTLRLRKPGT